MKVKVFKARKNNTTQLKLVNAEDGVTVYTTYNNGSPDTALFSISEDGITLFGGMADLTNIATDELGQIVVKGERV